MKRNSVDIGGGSSNGIVVSAGDGNTNTVITYAGLEQSPADLARLVRESTESLVAAAPTIEDGDEVRSELDRMSSALEGETPRPARAASRWETVKEILGPIASTTTAIATTVESISKAVAGMTGVA